MPFKVPGGYAGYTGPSAPRDFVTERAPYGAYYYDHPAAMAELRPYIAENIAVLDHIMGLSVTLDEEGVGYDDVPPPVVAALTTTWDIALWHAAICASIGIQLISREDPADADARHLAARLEQLASSTWMVATDHHVAADPAASEPDPRLLPWFCSVPEVVRDWMRHEHERWSEALFRREGLDPESGDLTVLEKARLEQLRRRLKDRGDSPI